MRISVKIESAKHRRSGKGDAKKAWETVLEGWNAFRKAAPGAERDKASAWVGGAIAAYASVAGKDRAEVLAGLERDLPLPTVELPPEIPMFKPGRSTPPPPRLPGAQRALSPEEVAAIPSTSTRE
jgi:hypothetical protein